jgi:hypothetical protein
VAFFLGVLFFLQRKRLPWLYTYALVFISLAMLILVLTGE